MTGLLRRSPLGPHLIGEHPYSPVDERTSGDHHHQHRGRYSTHNLSLRSARHRFDARTMEAI